MSPVQELDYLDDDVWGTVFRDVVLLALVGMFYMITVARKPEDS